MARKSDSQKRLKKRPKTKEIKVYDQFDTTNLIDPKKPLRLKDLGLELPPPPPTQVISIRLPSELLNEIKAIGSQRDIPYQALVKLFLSEAVSKMKKRAA